MKTTKQNPIIEPHRLNLGCGRDYRPGWVNVDNRSANPGSVADVEWDLDYFPWPVASASVDEILMMAVFEHLRDIERALNEVKRILKPGGVFRGEVGYGIGRAALIHWQHRNYFYTQTFEMIAEHFGFELVEAVNVRFDVGWKWRLRNYLLPGRLMEWLGHPDAYDHVRFALRKPNGRANRHP